MMILSFWFEGMELPFTEVGLTLRRRLRNSQQFSFGLVEPKNLS